MLISELQTRAPFLFKLLSKIVIHSDKRNQHKHGTVHHPGICVAVATILKERNKSMVGLQTLVSLLLFESHVQKQLYTRLNHLSLTLSYSAILEKIQQISQLRKVPIRDWIREGALVKFVGDNVDKKEGCA